MFTLPAFPSKTVLPLLACLTLSVIAAAAPESKPAEKPKADAPPIAVPGFTLKHNLGEGGKFVDAPGWVESDFSGKGKVRIEDGAAYLEQGNDMTGIRWTGPFPKMNYDLSLEAMRTQGGDFFCGLTFPYRDDPCSFIVGGWGGTIVGLSSLDYQDAANNETCRTKSFESNRWYKIRVRVTEKHIQAWIDDQQMVNVSTEGRKIGIRWEVEASRPLGIATWRTTGAIRNVVLTASTTPLPEPKEEAETWR